MNKTVKWIATTAIIAAIYVVLTVVLHPLSFGMIQIRFAEGLMILICFNKKYSFALIIGCLIANLFSFLFLDFIFGTLATVIACILMMLVKNKYIAWIFPVIANGIIVGIELYYFGEPLVLSMLSVAAGEAIAVLLGLLVFVLLDKNPYIHKLITSEDDKKTVVVKKNRRSLNITTKESETLKNRSLK